jgi:flagella basal body P-ring formation protein FlgA
MTLPLTSVVVIAAIGLTGLSAPAWSSPERSVATQALRAALVRQFPQVLAWRIDPVGGAPQRARTNGLQTTPTVVTLGARSRVDVGRAQYWFAVEGRERVAALRIALPRGARLSSEHLASIERNVFGSPCRVAQPGETAGKQLRRAAPSNAPLCEDLLEPVRAVNRGDAVRVQVRRGAIGLATAGIARGDASLGSDVPVHLTSTRRTVIATVIGDHEVRIHE